MNAGPVVVAVTGASGVIHARRLVEVLLAGGREVHLVASAAARKVIADEAPHLADRRTVFRFDGPRRPRVFDDGDLGAPFLSGSFRFAAMVVVPASMRTVGAIAAGAGTNCIHRAADVALKERRPLVVVPRESPLSAIHLRNLLALARAGAVVLPACPAFYHRPRTIDDQVDFIVGRILEAIGIEGRLRPRWGEGRPEAGPRGRRPRGRR